MRHSRRHQHVVAAVVTQLVTQLVDKRRRCRGVRPLVDLTPRRRVLHKDRPLPVVPGTLGQLVREQHVVHAAQHAGLVVEVRILPEAEHVPHGVAVADDLQPRRPVSGQRLCLVDCGDGILDADVVTLDAVRPANRASEKRAAQTTLPTRWGGQEVPQLFAHAVDVVDDRLVFEVKTRGLEQTHHAHLRLGSLGMDRRPWLYGSMALSLSHRAECRTVDGAMSMA